MRCSCSTVLAQAPTNLATLPACNAFMKLWPKLSMLHCEQRFLVLQHAACDKYARNRKK